MSLYCVLKQAYLDEIGDFNHHAPALNVVREEIGLLNPKRKYEHTLKDFNNEQSFEDIKALLSNSIKKLEALLEKKL